MGKPFGPFLDFLGSCLGKHQLEDFHEFVDFLVNPQKIKFWTSVTLMTTYSPPKKNHETTHRKRKGERGLQKNRGGF